MIFSLIVLALLGFCISLYTYVLEKKVKENPDFKPVCDLSDRVSCTKPMKSPYANLFFFSNATVGMGYYILIGLLAYFNMPQFLLIAAIGGVVVSCILAYILYVKIQSLCLLCTSLYIINALILFFVLNLTL